MTKVKVSLVKSELIFVEKSTNPRFQDIDGQVFNEFTVLGFAGKHKGKTAWYCECSCGTIKPIQTYHLLNEKVKSCGCKRKEMIGNATRSHGESKTKLYKLWMGVIKRCENPRFKDFKNYGGRGIKICSYLRLSFLNFKKFALSVGYKEGLTIDRKNVNGHYSCGHCRECKENNWVKNVRFVDMFVQAANKRMSSTNSSGIIGVGLIKSTNKWESHVTYKGKRVRTYYGDDMIDAAIARNKYITKNNLPHTLSSF